MQKNSELQQLFNDYKNLSEDQLDRLIALVVKQEKEKLGLNLPVKLKIDYDELAQNLAGGDSTLDYDDATKQYHYTIRLNGNEWYKQYLLNRNKTQQNGDMTFESSLDSLYNLVARVCHEMRHAYQNEQTHMRRDLSNPEALVWLKQELVVPDESFYREHHNYSNMPREVDAFNYQYAEALEYIRNYTDIEKDNPKFFTTLQETLNRNQRENVKPLDELTFIVNGKEIKATEYFNQNMMDAMKKQNITPNMIASSILRYEYNLDCTKKTFEQLMENKQKMIDGLDDKLPNYIHLVKKIDSIYDFIIHNNMELQQQQETPPKSIDSQQLGYSIEENGTTYIERQQQVLKDASGKEIGNRTISWNTDMNKGIEDIETIGTLENDDGKYSMKEVSRTIGGELQLQTKEMRRDNKITGKKEQFVYQKDKDGNELYFKISNGKTAFRITKNAKGITIDNYENGQLVESFEYDENGKALDGMGIPEIDQLDEGYIENFFDSQVPYFEAENKLLEMQQSSPKTVDTQRLGKETLDEQRDTSSKDNVESDMEMQTNTREEQTYYEHPETKTRSDASPESFKQKMRFEMTPDQYQEILDRHTAAEESFAKEMAEKPEKKKSEQTEYGVK